jgi:hypothetical protein
MTVRKGEPGALPTHRLQEYFAKDFAGSGGPFFAQGAGAHYISLGSTATWKGFFCALIDPREPSTQGQREIPAPESPDWMQQAKDLVERLRLEKRVQTTEGALKVLSARLDRLERICEELLKAPACIPISTLAPEPFEIIKDFYVVVQRDEDCFVATLFEANISTSGDSQQEAVANVIDLTLMMFRSLESEDDSKLGPAMNRQKLAIQSLIRRRSSSHV